MRNVYMTTRRYALSFGPALSKKRKNSLLIVLTFIALLTPTYAMAAPREGVVLFFSFADLTQMLSHPALPGLPSLPKLSPNYTWRVQDKAADREDLLERNARWDSGLGFDEYAYAAPRWSLWRF
jgi:hypothetical protein